jgi:hypothetical protein
MYKLHNDRFGNLAAVELIGKNLFIPIDAANTDYQVYLKWLDGFEPSVANQWIKVSESNTPLPADE